MKRRVYELSAVQREAFLRRTQLGIVSLFISNYPGFVHKAQDKKTHKQRKGFKKCGHNWICCAEGEDKAKCGQ